jgi:predicted enzyme related to lactoylglutathione lyase
MVNTFDWIELRVRQIDKSAAFFREVFGWSILEKVNQDGSPYWILDTGDNPRGDNLRRGALWLRPKGQRTGIVVYIHVADVDVTLRAVAAHGGKIIAAKSAEGRNLRAEFADPDGNRFGLWQEPLSGT